MVGRPAFPFEIGREIINLFLLGHATSVEPDSPLSCTNKRLTISLAGDATIVTVAWWAPDGSLQAKIAPDMYATYSMTVINVMLEALYPHPCPRVTRETVAHMVAPPGLTSRYFFDGTPVAIDEPFTLVGPLGIAAFRATNRQPRQ